jgi:hypothetical protein
VWQHVVSIPKRDRSAGDLKGRARDERKTVVNKKQSRTTLGSPRPELPVENVELAKVWFVLRTGAMAPKVKERLSK